MTHYVLSVDPGKASGIALVSWSGDKEETPKRVLTFEAQPDEYAENIKLCLEGWKQHDSFKVVCERFTITAQTVRNSQAPYSLEQIGILKHLCREAGYKVEDIIFQTPADAKNMFPNPALQTLEVWHKGGEGHANDALRHALLALVRQKWIPRVLLNKEK
jgi:hypothetical protein